MSFSWTDTAFFTQYLNQYDYIDYVGWGLKVDKNSDAARLGTKAAQTNTQVGFIRSAVTPVTEVSLDTTTAGLGLAEAGFQSLDFDDATTTMSQNTEVPTYKQDVWSSRTATVPSAGSQKLKVTAVVKNRYYFKVTDTVKIDNVQELTLNQTFRFTTGAKLRLNNDSGQFVNSGYIVRQDTANKKIYLAVNNNTWTNDTNTGQLLTEQFNEQSSYNIVGPIPVDINEIVGFTFPQVNNTTPGTFNIDLNDYNHPEGGSNNLDELASLNLIVTMIIQSESMKYLVLLHSLLVLLFKLLLQILVSTLHIRLHKLLILLVY